MLQWKRTRTILSILSIIAIIFLQHGTLAAQAENFRENMQKGETSLSQRNFEAAVNAYKSALKDARGFTGSDLAAATAQANLGLSRAYLGLGAFKNAIQSCDEALKHTGSNTALESMVRNQKGLAIVSSVTKPGDANLAKAIAEFRRVLEITDQDPIVSYNLGVSLLKFNKDAEGIHELQAFVARAGNTSEATTARKMIAEPRRARENFAPDFSLTTVDGEYVTLEDLKGKVVLLDFWGTWCPPCRESTPSLVRYSKRHPSEVFVMLGVAVNEPSADGWREYIEKNKMAWPQYLDSTRKIAALFKVSAFPTYITIDADGIIRDRRTGWGSETMTYIDDQVKKAVKAREKAGPPVLKTPERSAPPAGAPTTLTSPVPAVPAAPVFNPIAVAGATPVATPPAPVNTTPSTGVSVRGRVNLMPGAPAVPRVSLIVPGVRGSAPVVASVGPDGSFQFFNVPPGNYTLSLTTVPVPVRPITVINTDVGGIDFTVPPMRNIPGRVVLEGIGAMPQRLTFLIGYSNGSTGVSAAVQPDGNFTAYLPEGEHQVAVNALGYTVRAITHGSSDLSRNPLRLSNTDSEQIVVTLLANPGGIPVPGVRGTAPPPITPVTGPRGGPTTLATNPVVTYRVEAQYTDQARQARLEGSVRLQGIVRRDGTIDSIQVIQGLGMGLDEAAAAALKQWRFQPATRNGEPVDLQLSFTVNFSLK